MVGVLAGLRQKAYEERLQMERAMEDSLLRAVAGRQHMDIQTDDYLEDLDDAVFEQEIGTQTGPPTTPPQFPAACSFVFSPATNLDVQILWRNCRR